MPRHRFTFTKISSYDPKLLHDGEIRGGALMPGSASGIFLVDGNGDATVDPWETAWKLADTWWWGRGPTVAPAPPLTVTAAGRLADGTAVDLTAGIRFGPQGFGVDGGRGVADATLLDAGESLTFAAVDPLASFEFTAELRLRSGKAVVLIEASPGEPAFRLEGIRHGDRIAIDFAAREVRVNGVARDDAGDLFAGAADRTITIASGGGRAFAVGAPVIAADAPDAPDAPGGFDVVWLDGTRPAGAFAMVGDLDGDGVRDLLVAEEWSWESRLHVVSGARLAGQAPIALGDQTTWFGVASPRTMAVLGDADGGADYAVGGIFGSTRAYLGGVRVDIDTTFPADWRVRNHDTRVAAAGDVDGDGRGDLLLTLPTMTQPSVGNRPHIGAVFVVFDAALRGADEVLVLRKAGPGEAVMIRGDRDMTLAAAATLGDLDGDGHADLVVTGTRAGWDADRFGWTGATYVVSGAAVDAARSGSGVIELRTPNPAAFVTIAEGNAAAAVGDADGDGRNDVMLAVSEGDSCMIFGDAILALRATGSQPSDGFIRFERPVETAAFVGDIDGDGRDDLFLSLGGGAMLVWGETLAEARGSVAFDILDLAPEEAVRLDGRSPALFRFAGAAGDVDRDGHDDLLVSLGSDVLLISGARLAAEAREDGVVDMVQLLM